MRVLDEYLGLQKRIFDYFGYIEDWRILPIEDTRAYYWRLYGEGPGTVRYAETEALLDDPGENYYEDEIYTQRFMKKWVYRGDAFTLVSVDTRTDGNQLLRVFDNAKERSGAEANDVFAKLRADNRAVLSYCRITNGPDGLHIDGKDGRMLWAYTNDIDSDRPVHLGGVTFCMEDPAALAALEKEGE